ncbi:MAG: sigma 54-interacting transcriptional regulator [Myxococcales bacterium]|nr:sigma 54-interacting transcriptional regulator [Myxococcales bacterium]
MPHFQYTNPEGKPVRFPIVRRLTSIGSSSECHLVLSGPDVAATHCTLIHEPGRYKLESAQRSTPFFVRGRKTRSFELKHGDVVAVGEHELVFSAVDATAEPEPSSKEAKQEPAGLAFEGMRKLQQFSDLLARPADQLEALLDELIDQVVAMTRASKGFLVLANQAVAGPDAADVGDGYEIRVARNLERQPVDDPAELLSDNIIRETITSRKAQIISDAYADERFRSSLSVMNLKLCSVMCVPLLVRGELLGLIYVGNDNVRDLFRQEQLEMLTIFAAQAALFIKNAQLLNELKSESAELAQRLENVKFGEIIGACPQMVEVYNRVEKVASTDITVLVNGETGTGKELIAREIHNRSPRASHAFITVNCGAIPENLIESELFGHLKGAFTGAVANQIGKFQAADGGTIFLDEIGELPLQLQVKLLRVLQEKQIQRVGDAKTIAIDARVVAATNRDLAEEVRAGRFREDLYFRLNVIGIQLPPLRERGDDVLLIARYLVSRYAKEYGRDIDPAKALSTSALNAIMRFGWPGNIRQLENHIKKALVLADGPQITAADLDLELPDGTAATDDAILPLADARDRWQREYINRVLALNGGNRTKTARDLGVDPRTIFRHLEKVEKEAGG